MCPHSKGKGEEEALARCCHVGVGDVRNGVRDVVHGLVSHRTKRFFVIFMTNRNFLDFDRNEWQEGC